MVEFNDLADGMCGNQMLCRVGNEWAGTNGYVRYWDALSQTPFLFNGNGLVSYDDDLSLAAKTGYAVDRRLGGVMIWELSNDTRANSAHPNLLLNAVNTALLRPAAPLALAASKGAAADKIHLSWNAENGAEEYEIWRQDSVAFDLPVKIGATNTVNYNDSNITPNMTYYYKVKAKNNYGASGFSAMNAGFARSADLTGELDLRINNLPDGIVNLRRGQQLSLTINLMLTKNVAIDADWWILAETPAGLYCFNARENKWSRSDPAGITPAGQGGLKN